jgi:hypothetical protein
MTAKWLKVAASVRHFASFACVGKNRHIGGCFGVLFPTTPPPHFHRLRAGLVRRVKLIR